MFRWRHASHPSTGWERLARVAASMPDTSDGVSTDGDRDSRSLFSLVPRTASFSILRSIGFSFIGSKCNSESVASDV